MTLTVICLARVWSFWSESYSPLSGLSGFILQVAGVIVLAKERETFANVNDGKDRNNKEEIIAMLRFMLVVD
ncbi:hypothetical protein NIES806_18030 [Dolichospermum compactum NIES-806]|uniref:Uncharacterized protein n=1 Tax=Dolichospermum compactum NIES-806 TaxID=1973481 RepID=A0A1Z4V255_9CYAN|nr:hypothetical protein NIES806_18030 [Dolichospermum compactum NIES-806]